MRLPRISLRRHHTLPQKHRKQFEKLEINIDEPGNVVWRETKEHQRKSHILTKKWDEYFKNETALTKQDIFKMKDEFEMEVFGNLTDKPLK